MNTPTLIGSLVFAFVLAVLIGVVIRLMMRGWRYRGQLQDALIGTLPTVPDTVGAPTVAATRGQYPVAPWLRSGMTGWWSETWAIGPRRC
ncbi:hypothetical protein MMIN_39260 [Mycolicibacter minnesotensis]|nr:hypothetical protein MMIN_39260 [Mycolicibacter minnesotensis]